MRRYPTSAYAADLWHALAIYYYSNYGPYNDDETTRQIREALGIDRETRTDILIAKAPPKDYWPDVRRVSIEFPKAASLEDVLAHVSTQSGIRLRGIMEVVIGSQFRCTKRTVTIREFMQSLVDPGRTMWIREDDGYVLSPVPGIERKDPRKGD